MSWPRRVGFGVAVLAALAAGRAIDVGLPSDSDDRPFVRSGGIGDRVALVYADVTVTAVHTARAVNSGVDDVGTPGRWLVVDLTVVARGQPLATPAISLEDANGRSFSSDLSRSGYSWTSAPTGVPWLVRIPFEVPQDALAGATLTFSRDVNDDRRDDLARIDLGIESDEVRGLWDTQQTIEIPQAGTGPL
jgi:hypothetical protein